MSTKALMIGTIGAGCIAAAGIGGFVAARVAPAPASAESAMTDVEMPLAEAAAVSAPVNPAPPAEPAVRPTATRGADVPPAAPRANRPAVNVAAPAPAPPPAPAPVPDPPPDVWTPAEVSPAALPASDAVAPPALPDPPAPETPRFVELTIEEDAVIGIRLEAGLSSETAEIEDRVVARVTRDVIVAGRTAIPAGARIEGNVTLVDKGGRFRERARLGVRFTQLVLSDDSVVRLQTETIFRDGDSPTGEATSKVGASAVIGAILGGVIGGKKGAVIGGSAGAGAGTAAVMAGGANAATLAEGTPLTVRLTQPVTLLVERHDRER